MKKDKVEDIVKEFEKQEYEETESDRGPGGLFAPGNRISANARCGNKGNNRGIGRIKRLVDEELSDNEVKQLFRKLFELGMEKGNVKAIQECLDRKLGKVKPDADAIKESIRNLEESIFKRIEAEG